MASRNRVDGVEAAAVRGQDAAIGDVDRGVVERPAADRVVAGVGRSEDEKRALGVDASAGAGEHDYSPEATKLQQPGGQVIDTYGAGATSTHDNIAGTAQELVLGQAPQAPSAPMRGSAAQREEFHPDIPNAINRSPVVRGVEKDPRNDPRHPGFAQADRSHPDYGRPAAQHQGLRTETPTHEDLKRRKVAEAHGDDEDEAEDGEQAAA